MKKLSVFVFALLSVLSAAAQELSVKSFEAKVTDLTAKVDPVLDLNGSPCALIRVQIACKGCAFSGNIVGRPQEKPGEYLVWVPAGTRRLKIAHPDFLPLTYEFNLKIEKNCTYELRITLPQRTTEVDATGQHGKIMALRDLPGKLRIWKECGASDQARGWINMQSIQAIPNWKKDFPAFAACAAMGDWYVPSKDELYSIYKLRNILDEVAVGKGGKRFVRDFYWSSTQYDKYNAWQLNFGDGSYFR